MNKQRRQGLARIMTSLEVLRDEEQDYLDNMPEQFQDSAIAEIADNAIVAIEAAIASIDEAIG